MKNGFEHNLFTYDTFVRFMEEMGGKYPDGTVQSKGTTRIIVTELSSTGSVFN